MEPILFLQYHGTPSETRAGRYVAPQHQEVIRYREVSSVGEVVTEIQQWLVGNSSAYALFIGSHGDLQGLGPTSANFIDWDSLLSTLQVAENGISLWLGACESSSVVDAWSPIEDAGFYPDWILSFPNEVDAGDITPVLSRLVLNSNLNPITFLDEEISEIRRASFGTSAQMYYLVEDSGNRRYVNVDEFSENLGMTFREYLERQGGGLGDVLSEALSQLQPDEEE